MNVTITLDTDDVFSLATGFTPANIINESEEIGLYSVVDPYDQTPISNLADADTLQYGTIIWFDDQTAAYLAAKMLHSLSYTAFPVINDSDFIPNKSGLKEVDRPEHAVVTSWAPFTARTTTI